MPRSGRLLSNRIDIPFITMQLRYILNASPQAPLQNFSRNFRPGSLSRLAMADLFAPPPQETPRAQPLEHGPLADRLRPRALDQVIGQGHLTGAEGAIGRMVAAGKLSSMILWGPPGTGKTSIARLLADAVGMRFVAISAIFSGVADLKKVFAEAEAMALAGRRTLLFVDEITASTARSRMASCPWWKTARSLWSAPPPKTPALRSTPPCSAGRKCSSCTGSMRPPWANCCAAPRKRPASPCPHPARARGAGRLGRRRRALPAQPGGNPAGRGPARPARSRGAVHVPDAARGGL
jgi:hypothetical protein